MEEKYKLTCKLPIYSTKYGEWQFQKQPWLYWRWGNTCCRGVVAVIRVLNKDDYTEAILLFLFSLCSHLYLLDTAFVLTPQRGSLTHELDTCPFGTGICVFGLDQDYMSMWHRRRGWYRWACSVRRRDGFGGSCVLQPATLWVVLGTSQPCLPLEVRTGRTGDSQHKMPQEKLWLNIGRKKFHTKSCQVLGQMPVRLCILRGTEIQMDATLR